MVMPAAMALRIANADGEFVGNAPTAFPFAANIRERPYFKRNEQGSAKELTISEPFFSEFEQAWLITLSRRLETKDGAFAGVVVAAVPHTFFLKVYSQTMPDDDAFVAITDLNSRLLARYPEDIGKRGQILKGSTFMHNLQSGLEEGVYITPSHDDGVERVFAFSRVGRFNIAVISGIGTEQVLAEWQRKVLIFTISTFIIGLTLFAFLIIWVRNYSLLQKQAIYKEYYDEATNLPKYKMIEEYFAQNFLQQKTDGICHAVLMISIDDYAKISTLSGQATTNDVVSSIAERFSYTVGYQKMLVRFDDDKFVVLLSDLQHFDSITKFVDTFLDEMSVPLLLRGQEFHISCTIGISVYPNDGADMPTLLHNARVALEEGKNRRPGKYHFFSHELNEVITNRWWMESALPKALRDDELRVYYQPQFSLEDHGLVGLEALLRWEHPEKGFIPPSQFISVAESTGLIVPMGAWVLYEACRQGKEWLDMGLFTGRMAVNLSAVQLQDADLPDLVARVLRDTGLPPEHLELEITESTAMTDAENSIVRLYALHDLGVRISLDDFGTGYSNFSHLIRLPVSKLKIDRSLVLGLMESANTRAVVECIISVGHKLGMTCLAEGVESEEQKINLALHLCDEVQGYHTGKPRSPEAITRSMQLGDWM
ncbi:bifunctional diguanylate cyclase/phosphodiesterase [Nitratidesulfovibrio sp. 1201_IL3209]|uniref:bifunctional diguanylate cyclase/phosphodiesterase n=1 Tax=Nitratidesulfovibrio sp. 1201_IL3209 TaxID=3084053 RepID=UPI002FD8D455